MKNFGDKDWDEFHDPEIIDWKRVRGEIEHENNLINYRLMWFVLSQGLLFNAFASESVSKIDAKWVIPFVGILICIYLGIHLYAGQAQHEKLRKWWNEKYGENTSFKNEKEQTGANRHPPLCGCEFGGEWSTWFFRRVVVIYLFPLNFIIGWIALLTYLYL